MDKKDYGMVGMLLLLIGVGAHDITESNVPDLTDIPIYCDDDQRWFLSDVKEVDEIGPDTKIVSENGEEDVLKKCIPEQLL